MANIYFVACFVSLLFLITKFIEMRFVLKEDKPLKLLMRDTIIVYFSVLAGDFIMQQLNLQTVVEQTQIFTDAPDF
jgi:hypothetical protein|tara:strand:- start:92 stop:319 length:228 start_codon:yes stop_codon:yes gene_type:complete